VPLPAITSRWRGLRIRSRRGEVLGQWLALAGIQVLRCCIPTLFGTLPGGCFSRPGFGPAADLLSCRATRKEAKKRAQMPASPSLRYGATCVVAVAGFAVKLTSRCALRSDNHGESVDEAVLSFGRTATPHPPRRRRGHMGRRGRGAGATGRYAPLLCLFGALSPG